MKRLLFLLAVPAIKLIINVSNYLCARRVRDLYQKSFTKDGKIFSEQVPLAKRLFKSAGIGGVSVPFTEHAVGNHYRTGTAEVIDNLTSRNGNIVSAAASMFDELVGTFRIRMLDSISPIYWLKCIVFLPKHFLDAVGLGINAEKAMPKVINLLLTAIWWVLLFLLFVFRQDLYGLISDFLSQLN